MTPDPRKIKELIPQTFPDELQLLIRLCSPDEPDGNMLSELSRNCNLKTFSDLADRHRMLPFLASRKKLLAGLMPPEEFTLLNKKLDDHKHTALFRTNEVFRICRLFEQNNMGIMPIKGPCLAWQLYGDVTSRLSHDLDFLISDRDQATVKELMTQAGYEHLNVFSPKQNAYFYSRLSHHYSFFSAPNKILAEMHWKPFLNRHLYPVTTKEIFDNSVNAEISGNKVKLMSDDILVHYLCLHGSEHFWFRLHWLRDIAQIIYTQKFDLGKCIAKAVEYKIEKPVCESLLLAALVYNVHFEGSVLQDVLKHSSEWFIRQSLSEICDVSYEQKSHRIGVIFIKLRGKIHLKNDLCYRLNIMPAFKTTPSDWGKIRLPDSLFFLYKILHPFLWVLGKIGGKQGSG